MRRALRLAVRRLMHVYWRVARGMTLGARALVIDGEGCVLLIKHGYTPGWQLPGGGVEAGETLLEALARELREEGNIELTAPPALHAVYYNPLASRRDHVALFVVRAFRAGKPPAPNREIVAHGFFLPAALPADATRATRARIAEVLDGAPIEETW